MLRCIFANYQAHKKTANTHKAVDRYLPFPQAEPRQGVEILRLLCLLSLSYLGNISRVNLHTSMHLRRTVDGNKNRRPYWTSYFCGAVDRNWRHTTIWKKPWFSRLFCYWTPTWTPKFFWKELWDCLLIYNKIKVLLKCKNKPNMNGFIFPWCFAYCVYIVP